MGTTTTMNQVEQGRKMSQLIAKCWADEGFKRKLLADPAATLKAEGVELPADLSIKALENTDKVFHLVIPAKPTDQRGGAGGRARMVTQRRSGPGRRGGDDPSWG